tara:strand:- start:8096 stop:10303 length:2208 start_codon:yes stop_codon:yes gene_type:complete
MEFSDHKKERKEISKLKKGLEKKITQKLFQQPQNSDILEKLNNGDITEKQAEELVKARINNVTSIKLKGNKGRWVEKDEHKELEVKLNINNNTIKDIVTDLENNLLVKEPIDDNIIQIKISEIKPHPYNYEIYEPFESEDTKLRNDFLVSIEKFGVLVPIIVNPDYEIISGHRRYFASLKLELETVPIQIIQFDNDILAIIHLNKQREKNGTIIKNEFNELDKNLFKKLGGRGNHMKGGKSLDIYNHISKTFNISRGSATKLYRIFKEDEKLFTKIKLPQNPHGTISIDKAYLSLKSVKQNSKLKVLKEKNYISTIKSSLPNINSTELLNLLEDTYPFSLMVKVNRDSFTNISFDETIFKELDLKRKELIDDLEFKKSLTIRELLMFEKFNEIERTDINDKIKEEVYNLLWKPTDIDNEELTIKEIENIKPKLVKSKGDGYFNTLRIYTHSLSWNPNVGRNLKYMVIDESTNKLLGLIVVGSDVMNIQVRDKKIGWSNESKISNKKINNICMATTILPTYLLGFNFLGTKLISYLTQSDTIKKDWEETYGDVLVGITTTSLYGSFSSYNGVPNWKKLGTSKGKIILNPSKEIYSYWLRWLKQNHIEDYNKSMYSESGSIQSGPKQKILNTIFSYLNIKQKDFYHLNEKGVYFYSYFTNSFEFLQSKISEEELIPKKFDLEKVLKYWKPKSIKRYQKLSNENRLEKEFYWYEDLQKSELKEWLVNRGKTLISEESD